VPISRDEAVSGINNSKTSKNWSSLGLVYLENRVDYLQEKPTGVEGLESQRIATVLGLMARTIAKIIVYTFGLSVFHNNFISKVLPL
jgi:hypothetical protein